MNNSKIPQYRISVTMLSSKTTLLNNNNLFIPVNINKSQAGTENLYSGKVIYLFINNVTVKTIYKLKSDSTEYLQIDNLDIYNTIDFAVNSVFQYNEIDLVSDDYGLVTLSDIKLKFKASKDGTYKGVSGLLEPIHLKALEEIKYLRPITSKTLNNLNNGISLMFVEKVSTDTSFDLSFNLSHSLFNLQYDIKVFGNNFLIKTNKFSVSNTLSNLNLELSINKIASNDGVKNLYQIYCKFINLPTVLVTNPENVIVQYFEDIINTNVLADSPASYIVSNYTILVNPKLFNRNVLYHDINGPVSVNLNESTKLTGTDNLINILNIGWYHYDIFNNGDSILTGLPTGVKNVFHLNVKKLSSDITVQYLYILDASKNEIRTFSRFKNQSTLSISNWIEYVTQNHKHVATDITETTNKMFVTQAQINYWNSFSASLTDYWNDAVLNVTDLPTTATNGECRLVVAINQIYTYDSNLTVWKSVTGSKIDYEINSSTLKIKINGGLTLDQIVTLPEVTENSPGIVSPDIISDYKGFFESKLNFTPTNTGTEVPTSYERPLDYTFNIYENNTDKIFDGVTNYLTGLAGITLTVNLTNITDKIQKTLYTKTDNNNIFTGVVTKYQFSLVTDASINQILVFGTDKTVTLLNNGILTNITESQIVLGTDKNYLVKIDNNNIKLYAIYK